MGEPRPRRHKIRSHTIVRRALPWLAVLGTAALTAECAEPAHAQWYDAQEMIDIIDFWGRWWHADVGLLQRVAYRESRYNPRAYNPRGPYLGLFQFHPNTWGWMSDQAGAGAMSPYDPDAAAQTAAWAFTHTDARGRPLRLHWPTAY